MAKKKTAEKPAAGSESHGRRMPASKSDAVRMAIAAGFDGPQVGAGYIQSQFGLDVSPEHFSAVKSADKKKVLTEEPKGKPGRKPKADTPTEYTANGEVDLLAAIETMKPLVAALGADKVKKIADLLG